MIILFLIVLFTLHLISPFSSFFFFNDTATTEIYTLSLHDALPISMAIYQPVTGAATVLSFFWHACATPADRHYPTSGAAFTDRSSVIPSTFAERLFQREY